MAKKRGKTTRKIPKAPQIRKIRKAKAARKKIVTKAFPVVARAGKSRKKRKEKPAKKRKEKRSLKARARLAYGFYFVIWLAAFAMAVLSIIEKDYIYAAVASFVMFFCSLMTAIVHKNLNKKEVIAAMKKLLQRKSKRYETNFDKLLELLKKYKKVKISYISKGFGVSKEKVVEWSEILESHNFLKVRYPLFGEAELVTKGEKSRKK